MDDDDYDDAPSFHAIIHGARREGNGEFSLTAAYTFAVALPAVGLGLAVYVAVAERTASIRRHAIGLAAVSIAVWLVVAAVLVVV